MSATVTQSVPANSAAESTSPSSILLHPHSYDPAQFDTETRRLLVATIKWFEQRGLRQLLEDFHAKRYYTEFLEFLAKEKVLATFLTPAQNADGNRESAGTPHASPPCRRLRVSTASITGTHTKSRSLGSARFGRAKTLRLGSGQPPRLRPAE